jgi:predicted 3-demethylubiquinone-9 3-methyltransferase (glyoxalase superfamily)
MQKITPFLWFDNQAEEAAAFYVSVFGGTSRIVKTVRYGKAGPGPEGSVMTVLFELDGQQVTGLNGGPRFKFSEAISLSIACTTQEEIDRYWARLTEGGEEGPCGWLKDKYGLSWQVTPAGLETLLADPDPRKSENVMKAMLQMRKLSFAGLKRAYEKA